jgi:hypothetical protein
MPYSPNESFERIYRVLIGEIHDDRPDLLGQMPYNESLSKIAQVLEGSLPNFVIPGAVSRYGCMHADNVTGTVAIGATDTMYAVTGSMSAGLLDGFTFRSNSELICGFTGKYVINYSLSILSSSANQEVETTIMVNGIASTELSAHTEATGISKPYCLSGSAVLSLAVGDVIQFGVSNHTGTNNLIVQHATLSIVYISA